MNLSSCGCGSCGCVCFNHMDIPRGIRPGRCVEHAYIDIGINQQWIKVWWANQLENGNYAECMECGDPIPTGEDICRKCKTNDMRL